MELNKQDDVCAVDEESAALAVLVAGAIPGLSAVVKESTETYVFLKTEYDSVLVIEICK